MKLTTGMVLAHMLGAMVRSPGVLLLWLILIGGAGFAVDASGSRADYIVALTSTFAQFLTISAVLRAKGIHHAWGRAGRVASYIGLGIVSTLSIGLGFALLVIPGLYLYARWLITTPLVIGEGARMGEAMATSWRRTRESGLALTIAVAVVLLPILLGAVVMALYYPEYGLVPWEYALASNVLVALGFVASWFLAATAHALLLPEAGEG